MALAAMNQVLVVAAHLDSELLRRGGTISRLVDSGDQVLILMVTKGLASHHQKRDSLQVEIEHSSLTLGCVAQAQVGSKPMHASYLLSQLL